MDLNGGLRLHIKGKKMEDSRHVPVLPLALRSYWEAENCAAYLRESNESRVSSHKDFTCVTLGKNTPEVARGVSVILRALPPTPLVWLR